MIMTLGTQSCISTDEAWILQSVGDTTEVSFIETMPALIDVKMIGNSS